MSEQNQNEVITLGGGCFWCLEPIFAELRGVTGVVVGYAGGSMKNPTYQQVCGGFTGHAEVVQVTFSPNVIQLDDLLEIFFHVHDPTTPNRQGADVGPQYRSIILYHTDFQKKICEAKIRSLNTSGNFSKPIVTEVVPLDEFYIAEEHHQQYFQKNPWAGYCQVVIHPKIQKFHQLYEDKLKSD
ncbi:MAG: peptide-methionine (S)-S-oxide reductase [Chloroflexi bacterium HGW-Chloroflexi-10]|nr:MAG: peptide-methionine (S)-S-oxide reductase [Chloroflexi bacterium HGW-Chloroflexi-10]